MSNRKLDNWNFTVDGLANILCDGRDAIKAGLKRLEAKGYLTIEQLREKGLFSGNCLRINVNPVQQTSALSDNENNRYEERGAIFAPPISEKRGGAMGALDAEAKQYLGKRKTLADAFNYLLYDGEQVIDPENLKEMDTAQLALPYGNNARLPVQKYRDLLKIWEAMTDGNAIYVILGAELQGKVHYAMPIKDGLYDMIGYSNQVEENRRSLKNRDKKESSDETAELYAEDGVLKIKLTSEEFLSGFRKEDRLIPIITAVIYVGPEPWDGPNQDYKEYRNL